MAWRPNECFLEGELDNSIPGRVTGWMHFAGLPDKVTFELEGDSHRDIRGAKIRLRGNEPPDEDRARRYMEGFATLQVGKAGDITAGRPPQDYVNYPYIEWYSDHNGRVVLELEPHQVEVVGTPIPACESDPLSREAQTHKMAEFLAGVGQQVGVPAIAVGGGTPLVSDPAFSHWVVEQNRIIGEARNVTPQQNGTCFAFVRLPLKSLSQRHALFRFYYS